jgi:hypothetical protein
MTPVLITRATLAASAAGRWREQYTGSVNPGFHWYNPNDLTTYEQLVALGPAPDPDDVDRVIGNGAWTFTPACNGCCKPGDGTPRVRVGDEPGYESNTVYLCLDCVKAAVKAFADAGPVTVANEPVDIRTCRHCGYQVASAIDADCPQCGEAS